jgi:hypothetical protein
MIADRLEIDDSIISWHTIVFFSVDVDYGCLEDLCSPKEGRKTNLRSEVIRLSHICISQGVGLATHL